MNVLDTFLCSYIRKMDIFGTAYHQTTCAISVIGMHNVRSMHIFSMHRMQLHDYHTFAKHTPCVQNHILSRYYI